MRKIGFAICFWAVLLDVSAAQGASDNAGVLAAMKAVQSFTAKDPFDAPPEQVLIAGKPFRLSWPLKSGHETRVGTSTTGIWSYDPASGILSVTIGSFMSRDKLVFAAETREGKPYAAHNAFGVGTVVKSYETVGYGIATANLPYDGLSANLKLDPATARDLSQKLSVEVEGTMATGRPISCSSHQIEPTITTPISMSFTDCLATATVSRVLVRRTDTGEVLQQWFLN